MRFTRGRRMAAGVLALVVAAAAGLVLAAEPLATWRTREALRGLEGYRGTFGSVDVRLRDLAMVIHDLRLDAERPDALLTRAEVERAEIVLAPRPLLGGDVVARVTLDAPRVRLVQARARPGGGQRGPLRARAMPAALPEALLERLEVHEGVLLWSDASDDERHHLRIDGIEGTVRNLATRAALAAPGQTSLAARGRLQRSGKLRASMEADATAERLTFRGRAELDGLELTDVAGLIEAGSDFEPDGGSFHMAVELRAEDGDVRGAVHPLVESPRLSGEGGGLAAAAKGAIANRAIDGHTEDAPGARGPALAGSIPISGEAGYHADPVPTFLAILGTAFARGLADGLSLPPGSDDPIRVAEPR